jgi:hypothetical protein
LNFVNILNNNDSRGILSTHPIWVLPPKGDTTRTVPLRRGKPARRGWIEFKLSNENPTNDSISAKSMIL